MRVLNLLVLSLVLFSQATLSFAGTTLQVRDAWIPQAPPVADVMAAYFEIANTGDKAVTVTGVSCAAFNGVMMHKTIIKDGMSRMVHQGDLTVAPKSTVKFQRGGLHLMLMGPKHGFKVGDKVPMVLETRDKQHIKFEAVVKPASFGEDAK
jgi:copper(I)-binding protein